MKKYLTGKTMLVRKPGPQIKVFSLLKFLLELHSNTLMPIQFKNIIPKTKEVIFVNIFLFQRYQLVSTTENKLSAPMQNRLLYVFIFIPFNSFSFVHLFLEFFIGQLDNITSSTTAHHDDDHTLTQAVNKWSKSFFADHGRLTNIFLAVASTWKMWVEQQLVLSSRQI